MRLLSVFRTTSSPEASYKLKGDALLIQRAASSIRKAADFILIWLDRLTVIDWILFVLILYWKLHYFNKLLSVPYMELTPTTKTMEFGALLIVSFWTLLLPARGRIFALVTINFLLSLLMFSDSVYYRYFQDLITVPVLMQVGQVESVGGSITTLIAKKDFVLFADFIFLLPFMVYLFWKGGKALRQAKKERQKRKASIKWGKPVLRLVLSGCIILLGSQLFLTNFNAVQAKSKSLFAGNWWNLSLYNAVGGLGFHGYDLSRYAKMHWFKAETVTAEQITETEAWFKERGQERKELEKDPLFGAYKGKNVLMVQVEALQDFMFDKSIGGTEITPNLNKLAEESAYFTNFYHQTSNGRTSDADFSAHCSMQPIMNGSVFIQYSGNTFDCTPDILKSHGYSANVFHAYQGGFWNRNAMYRSMNYDMFYNLKHYQQDEAVGWSVGDKSFFRQSMDVVAEQKAPFYAFMITLTSHHPYSMPEAQKLLDVGELKDTILGNYLQSVHYVDAAVGELIERLKSENLWDNTILVLYGDHDNSIKEWDQYEQFLGKPYTDFEQKRFNKQVPLMIHFPDSAHSGEYKMAAGQTDLAPTVLHLLGISTADSYMVGMPLMLQNPLSEHIVVQRFGAWSNEEVYYIPTGNGKGTCYSLATGEPVEESKCAAGTELANNELMMSDQIVHNNLIKKYRKNNALEVMGANE